MQPAERLWPLPDEAAANRTFADLDELSDVLSARVLTLEADRATIKSHTRYHWWPTEVPATLPECLAGFRTSGRNGRRTILGALCPATGELVVLDRTRARTDDLVAFVAYLGSVRPETPKLLIRDNAPPHHPHWVREAAAANITLCFLPFRSPELMPLEELWRELKRVIAANRAYAALDELVARAMHWLETMTPDHRRRTCARDSGKYSWLAT